MLVLEMMQWMIPMVVESNSGGYFSPESTGDLVKLSNSHKTVMQLVVELHLRNLLVVFSI